MDIQVIISPKERGDFVFLSSLLKIISKKQTVNIVSISGTEEKPTRLVIRGTENAIIELMNLQIGNYLIVEQDSFINIA